MTEDDLLLIPGGLYLEKAAAKAFKKMYTEARTDGLLLRVNSAYRSSQKQKTLYVAYIKALGKWDKAGKVGKRPSIVAPPGKSNHERGIAVDINRANGDNLTTPEPDSPIDNWLKLNAHKYGFFRTVPSEPWHWEYRPERMTNG